MANISPVKNYLAVPEAKEVNKKIEVSSFYIGKYLFGIDILLVQEINPYMELTPVPHAPFHIRGVMNLRGQIVTVIDMREVLGLEKVDLTSDHRNIIIESEGEWVGLLVDSISDVVEINPKFLEPAPRVRGMDVRFIKGVYKLQKELLMLLDIYEVMKV